jgi:hypothetical protein
MILRPNGASSKDITQPRRLLALKDINPEDYPDIHKLAILADVAPYSREYNTYRQKIGRQAQGSTELEIEYEKILNRVKRTRESVIRMTDRHYTKPVDEISGTVESASPGGITLKEYPGRTFQFSSVSTSAADMSARILGEKNDMTRSFRPDGTPHLARPRRKLPRSGHLFAARHGSSFMKHTLASSPAWGHMEQRVIQPVTE